MNPGKRIALIALCVACFALPAFAADPLPSWNDTASKKAIFAFVEKVTKSGAPDFVPPAERIATFDQDGTLWAEQPMYFQFFFALDRVKALAPQHPEWTYDRASSIGRLDMALDEAQANGWTVVDMKSDWKIIFPF